MWAGDRARRTRRGPTSAISSTRPRTCSSARSTPPATLLDGVDRPDRPLVPGVGDGGAHRPRPRDVSRRATSTRRRPRCSPRSTPIRSRPTSGTHSPGCAPRPTSIRPTFVARIPDDRVLEVLASLRASAPAGCRPHRRARSGSATPGDPRVLALVPSFAAKLDSMRAMEWSARIRAADMGRLCPLIDRAEDRRVDAPERVRAAALAHASFGDSRARRALDASRPDARPTTSSRPRCTRSGRSRAMLADDVRGRRRDDTRAFAARSRRCSSRAARRSEAYAVLVHGLSLETRGSAHDRDRSSSCCRSRCSKVSRPRPRRAASTTSPASSKPSPSSRPAS